MRWFIAFLVVANVILFFWMQQQSRPVPGSQALPPPDIGRLRLMSEVEREAAKAVDDGRSRDDARESVGTSEPPDRVDSPAVVTGDDTTAPAPRPVAETETETEMPAEGIADGSESIPDRPAADDGVAVSGPSVSTVPPLTVPEPSAAMPLDMAGGEQERVMPVESAGDDSATAPAGVEPVDGTRDATGELAGDTTAAPVPTADPRDAVVEAVIPEPACARLGPFSDEEAGLLLSRLPGFLALVSDVTEETTQVDGYYVMIPPLASRAEGLATLKALEAAGISDTWLFRKGPNLNAISLGLFSKEASAGRHATNVANKGFNAEVRPRTRREQARWLLLRRDDGGDIVPHLLLPETVTHEPLDCPSANGR